MKTETERYRIEIQKDETFTPGSADNHFQYKNVYLDSDFIFPVTIGIKVYENNALQASAIIGSPGGGTGVHATSHIIEDDRLVLCCSASVFCLSLPDLKLLWKTRSDKSTCFEIFQYKKSYIVHGEMEITRLDHDGNVLWQRSGADIFTTEKGTDDFEITDMYIRATDWENRTYKFNFNGEVIE